MAGSGIRISNQIAKVQTAKKCISLMDKLKVADPRHYAQLHAKGETSENGFRQNSLIQVIIQDYSNGTGTNNVRVSFNLSPEQIQFFLTRVEAGFLDFEYALDKIFGNPDQSGYCQAQQFRIKRSVLNDSGQPNRSPWNIWISNGKGIKIQNKNGGAYMKSGSYRREASAFIQLTDMDFYMLLKRTDSYITVWERYAADQVLAKGLEMFNSSKEAASQYGQPQYGQPQYGQPQYGVPQYENPAPAPAPAQAQAPAQTSAPAPVSSPVPEAGGTYGQPVYGQPLYGQPLYGAPQYYG